MLRELSNSNRLIPVMVALSILAAGAGFYVSLKLSQQQQQQNPGIEGFFWPNPKQITNFNAIDHQSKPFGLNQIKGKWSFIFFGYTHCPDICPVTLSIMADAYNQLASNNTNTQIIFVTVDPERDTTEKLSRYVSYFNEHFIGLGGNSEMIDSLTKQIGVAYYLNKKGKTDNYLVDHSASIFIIDPNARMVAKLSAPHESGQIVQRFTKIKDFINAQN